MKLVIDRKQWLRGEGGHRSYLLRKSDRKMCCLGFFSLACGLREDQILGVVSPRDLLDSPTQMSFLFDDEGLSSSFVGDHLMATNDDPSLHDADREKNITRLFAENGIEVSFVN